MRIVLAGIIGRYPWGGVAWCSLMYLIGLRKLGHEVWYLEDTLECNFDPDLNAISTDPSYALRHLDSTLRPFGFGDRWCYVDYKGVHHGLSDTRLSEICSTADLFLVLSGGCWVWRDHYLRIPRKAFIDSDPGFTQIALERALANAEREPAKDWYVDFFEAYDSRFTFGSLIAKGTSRITSSVKWHSTWQPIDTDLWHPGTCALPHRKAFTTVMTWCIESFQDIGGNKDHEFLKILHLPKLLGKERATRIELAVAGTTEVLQDHGWRCIDAFPISSDIWRYHNYLTSSMAEFSVAKRTYVEGRTGWFSDRSECYLASGRPVLVQDTGFSEVLPTGEGLLTWDSVDDIIAGLEEIESHYELHSRRAREVAMEHFRDIVVLPSLLDRAMA